MRVGIVGSRRRESENDRRIVYDIVRRHIVGSDAGELVVISGACPRGADFFARQAVDFFRKEIGDSYVRIIEFPVRTWPGQTRWEFREQAFFRNRTIVENSDLVYALVHEDREGGTENTVGHCHDLKIPVHLVDGTGRSYLDKMGSDATEGTDKTRAS